jgi:hypothetical protein
MLYFKYFITLSILLFSSSENPLVDNLTSNRIAWEQNYQLDWNDFKGRAQTSSSLDAYTMLGISLEVIGQKDGKVDMGVFGYFEKNKSWVKSGEKTDNLLSHERKHFDLCEVYRRKLIKKLEAKKSYDYDTFSDDVGKMFNENFEAYTKEQERYDEETHHSQKKEDQIKWNKFITKELLRLKKYDKIAATLNVVD